MFIYYIIKNIVHEILGGMGGFSSFGFLGLALRWQKPNVLKCAVGLRYGMKPNNRISNIMFDIYFIPKLCLLH